MAEPIEAISPKTMDVSRTQAGAQATSRPLIIGHGPAVQDPMVGAQAQTVAAGPRAEIGVKKVAPSQAFAAEQASSNGSQKPVQVGAEPKVVAPTVAMTESKIQELVDGKQYKLSIDKTNKRTVWRWVIFIVLGLALLGLLIAAQRMGFIGFGYLLVGIIG